MPGSSNGLKTLEEIDAELAGARERFERSAVKGRPDLRGAVLFRRLTRRRKFTGEATARRFEEKRDRLYKAITLEIPDRIPIITSGLNFYPPYYAGITMAEYCNDRKRCAYAFLKFCRENTYFDAIFPSHFCCLGPIIQATQLDILKLPGVHLPENVSYQFFEKERMRPDEYQRLLDGGLDFLRQEILPRMSPLYRPGKGWDRRTSIRVGAVMAAYMLFLNRNIDKVEKDYGVPIIPGAFFFAPYDLISFLFRGLKGISTDIFQRPEMVERSADLMVSPALWMIENFTTATGAREAVILCERAFSLSPKHFARFYLPSLKKLVLGLLDRGIVPLLAMEGDCTHLLEFLLEFPPQRCFCALDTGDVFRAKRILGGHMCIAGNVPMNMMVVGTPKDIKDYCARMIDELAPGGGFVMSGALGIPDNAKLENIHAMIEYTEEHGGY